MGQGGDVATTPSQPETEIKIKASQGGDVDATPSRTELTEVDKIARYKAEASGVWTVREAAFLRDIAGKPFARLILASSGIDVNMLDTMGRTALYNAVGESDCTIVRLLLTRKDVLVDRADAHGETPLQAAERLGHRESAALLKGAGTKPSTDNGKGGTGNKGGTGKGGKGKGDKGGKDGGDKSGKGNGGTGGKGQKAPGKAKGILKTTFAFP